MLQQLTTLIQEIHLLYPFWLWLWPVSVCLLWLLLRYGQLLPLGNIPSLFNFRQYRHTRTDILQHITESQQLRKDSNRPALRWLSYSLFLLLLHVSLAHPYRLGKQLPNPPAYRDTIFIVDTSISMLLKDYLVEDERVDRMTMMKSVLTLFINQLKGNRIGVIAFSEQAYTLVPLTTDYALLKTMVRRLKPAVLTGRTSHPGKALLYTLQQLQQTTALSPQKPVLVMISDVNRPDREFDPRTVAKYIHQQGYRIHTIGIGASTYKAGKSKYSGLIFHPANFSILEAIAENGQGKFYWADNARSLQAAMQAIQSNERRKVEIEPRFIQRPLYHWPLLLSLGLIMGLQLWPGNLLRK